MVLNPKENYDVKRPRTIKKDIIKLESSENQQEDFSSEKLEEKGNVFKEGQKYVCPPIGDPTRAFYETLLKERPNSLLANKFCIEHGILIGTQLKVQLERYYALRDFGAFKNSLGGVKPIVKDILKYNTIQPLPKTKIK